MYILLYNNYTHLHARINLLTNFELKFKRKFTRKNQQESCVSKMKINYPVTSRFLEKELFRNGKNHSGLDFAMPDNTPLRSIKDGVVEKVVNYGNSNVGKGILVRWEDGKVAIYGHLSKFKEGLSVGDKISTGDIVGYSGHSGHVVSSHGGNGAHLHFGLKNGDGNFIDPSPYIEHIQKMNDTHFLASLPEPTQVTENIFKIGNLFGNGSFNEDLLHLFKSNFISFIVEFKTFSINLLSSIDYSIWFDYLQFIFKFLS